MSLFSFLDEGPALKTSFLILTESQSILIMVDKKRLFSLVVSFFSVSKMDKI